MSAVLPHAELLPAALALASRVASHSRPVSMLAKEAVKAAFETPLAAGARFERKVFQTTFGLEDKHEGTAAFMEKRQPQWRHR